MRRALVIAALVAVGALAWLLTSRDESAITPPAPSQASATSAQQARPTTTPSPAQPREMPSTAWQPKSMTPTARPTATASLPPGSEHAWETPTRQFGIRYADPTRRDVRSWVDRLRPYVTGTVYNQLRKTDLTTVPEGHYETAELLEASQDQVAAQIFYTEGWSLIVYLQPSFTGAWRIEAYDRVNDEDSD